MTEDPITRRELVGKAVSRIMATSTLAGSIAAAGIPNTANAMDFSFADATTLGGMLHIDPVTLSYMVFGPCCWYCPTVLLIAHFQPLLLVEVIRSTEDSVIAQERTTANWFATVVDNMAFNNTEVRIWEIPDWLLSVAMAGQDCKLCGKEYAPRNNFSDYVSFGGISLGDATDLSESAEGGFCGGNAASKQYVNLINEMLPDCFPKLLYDSSADFAWRTGCHDILDRDMLNPMQCIGYQEEILRPSALNRDPICLGPWARLKPRQFADHHMDERISASVSASRAIHYAADYGYMEWKGDPRIGKLQMISPEPGIGHFPGSRILTEMLKQQKVSPRNVYLFTWWLPVGCCKSSSEVYGVCAPEFSC